MHVTYACEKEPGFVVDIMYLHFVFNEAVAILESPKNRKRIKRFRYNEWNVTWIFCNCQLDLRFHKTQRNCQVIVTHGRGAGRGQVLKASVFQS